MSMWPGVGFIGAAARCRWVAAVFLVWIGRCGCAVRCAPLVRGRWVVALVMWWPWVWLGCRCGRVWIPPARLLPRCGWVVVAVVMWPPLVWLSSARFFAVQVAAVVAVDWSPLVSVRGWVVDVAGCGRCSLSDVRRWFVAVMWWPVWCHHRRGWVWIGRCGCAAPYLPAVAVSVVAAGLSVSVRGGVVAGSWSPWPVCLVWIHRRGCSLDVGLWPLLPVRCAPLVRGLVVVAAALSWYGLAVVDWSPWVRCDRAPVLLPALPGFSNT